MHGATVKTIKLHCWKLRHNFFCCWETRFSRSYVQNGGCLTDFLKWTSVSLALGQKHNRAKLNA